MYALRAVVLITDNNRQLPSTTDNYRQQADNYRQQAVNYRQEAEINCVGSAICLTHAPYTAIGKLSLSHQHDLHSFY